MSLRPVRSLICLFLLPLSVALHADIARTSTLATTMPGGRRRRIASSHGAVLTPARISAAAVPAEPRARTIPGLDVRGGATSAAAPYKFGAASLWGVVGVSAMLVNAVRATPRLLSLIHI